MAVGEGQFAEIRRDFINLDPDGGCSVSSDQIVELLTMQYGAPPTEVAVCAFRAEARLDKDGSISLVDYCSWVTIALTMHARE